MKKRKKSKPITVMTDKLSQYDAVPFKDLNLGEMFVFAAYVEKDLGEEWYQVYEKVAPWRYKDKDSITSVQLGEIRKIVIRVGKDGKMVKKV